MKKIFSLLTLLVCFVGAYAATATTVYERTLATWVSTDVGTGAWVGNATVDNDKGLYVSGSGNRSAVLTFSHTDFSIQTYDIEFNNAGNTGNNNNYSYVDIGNNLRIRSNQQAQNGHVIINGVENAISNCNKKNINRGGDVWTIHIEINTATNTLEALTLSGDVGGTKAASFTLAEPASLGSTATYNTVAFGTNRAGGTPAAGIKAIKITEEEQAIPTSAYTINYQLSGTTVKTDAGETAIGNSVNATGPFTVDNQKYYIVDGAQTEFAVAISGNNFNVPVRKANEYTCTVKTNLGTVLSTTTVVEGENTNYYVPYYNFEGGKFYTSPSSSAGSISYGQGTISNVTSNIDVTVTYTEEAKSNVVFYSEAENLTGVTPYTDGYTNIRMSNGSTGYYAASTPFVTLQPGVYTLTSATRSGSTTFYAEAVSENNVLLTLSSSGSVVTSTSEEFIIDKPTDILTSVGGTKAYFDYVIIRKTADYVATEDLEINEAALEIGKSTTLTATITPANATRKTVYWSIGGAFRAKGVNKAAEPEEEEGEAEINAETGVITPIKAGWVYVNANNGEYSDYKQLYISPAEFAVAIEDAPAEAFVYVGDDQSEGETIKVTTKDGFDNMKNTSLLNPDGSISATRIPNYIYDITFDKANKTITAVYQEDIAVTAMAFTPAAQRIAAGNARTFKVTYSPANASFKTATWVSSDPTVATVSGEGFITALKEGVTTITATWTENDSHHTNFSAQMTLTVDKGLVIDRIVYDQMEDGTAEVMGYYHPMDGDTLFLPAKIFSNGAMIPVSFIKQEAFIGSNLKSIVVPGTVKIIDHRALMYSNTHNAYNENPEEGLESAFLMEGVEVMRDRIFHGNKYMTKVFLPSTLTDIGYYSFYGTDIKDVYFGGTEEQWNALKNLSDSKLPETAKIHFGCNLPSVFVNAITVAEEYVEMDAEEIFDLDAQIAPAYFANETDLTYTSSNEDVATVDENGVITAVADGTAIITVSAQSGVEVKVKVQVGEVVRDFTTPLTTTWSVQGGANPEGIFVDEETHYYNNWGTGTSWFAQAYAEFDLSNLLPTDDFRATFTVWVNCARGTRTFDVYGLPAGTTVADCQELTAKKGVELATYSDITTTYVAKEVDATAFIKDVLANGATNAIFIMSNGAAGGNIYGKGSAEFAPTLTIFPANAEGGQTTGIDAAKAAKKISFGKYLNNKGQIIIVKDGNEYNALGVQQK